MTPLEAHDPSNEPQVYDNLYRSRCKDHCVSKRLKLNDTVRVSRYPSTFMKSYRKNFSTEYFLIDSIERTIPVVYRLKDLAGEKIQGAFYEPELKKITVNPDTPFEIESILEDKGNRVLVKWVGWPNSMNSWILKKNVKDIKKKVTARV